MTRRQPALTVGTQQVSDAILGLLTRVEVRESDDDASMLALRFKLAQGPKGVFSPLDAQLFTPAAPLALDMADDPRGAVRLFQGYVTHVRPHFEVIEANCYLEVLGMDAAVLLDAGDSLRVFANGTLTDSQLAEEVLKPYTALDKQVSRTTATHDPKRHMVVQRESDWAFLRRLAHRNGFVCHFQPSQNQGNAVCYFGLPPIAAPKQANLIILQDKANLHWIDLQLTGTGPTQVTGKSIDPIAKRELGGTLPASLPSLPRNGTSPLESIIGQKLSREGAPSTTAVLGRPENNADALQSQVRAGSQAASFAVEARGATDQVLYGGLLRARRPVSIFGIGDLFAGDFYVRAVHTLWADDVVSQSFVAVRNALGR